MTTDTMTELSTSEMAEIDGGFGLLLIALTAFYVKGTTLGAFE